MSVPEGLRSTSKLDVIVSAQSLAKYTIQITKNQKYFPPEYNNGITNNIIEKLTQVTEIIIKSLCGWIVITNHSGKEKTMALISRTNPEQQNEIDRLKRENAKLTALLDYVAVMTDVEIPEDEEGGNTDVEEN